MVEMHTDEEVNDELNSPEFISNVPAFSGRSYPLEYLGAREFELLAYFLFKKEIEQGMHKEVFDTVRLMKGGSDKGRDLLLQNENKNVGIIQCKRYKELIQLPQLAREIIKFVLHAIQEDSLISEPSDFRYYFVALAGFNERAQSLLTDFNNAIIKESKLKDWVEEVIEENKSIKINQFEDIETDLKKILSKITVEPITGEDLDLKLKNNRNIVSIFFEVEKVASEDMLRRVFDEYVGFRNDEDLEKLRNRLQDLPEDKRMNFGVFSIYGYDLNFYKKLIKDKKIMFEIADARTAINQRFIDYLLETIEKHQITYISGLKEVSAFTKQVVVPYLFNKYALQFNMEEMGGFMSEVMLKNRSGLLHENQSLEDHKKHLLEVGQQVLDKDFSKFAGDDQLIAYKKEIALRTHNEFKSVDEMSERFDQDWKILEPIVNQIETSISEIMPKNPTIIIGNAGLGDTKEDFKKLLEKVKKFDTPK